MNVDALRNNPQPLAGLERRYAEEELERLEDEAAWFRAEATNPRLTKVEQRVLRRRAERRDLDADVIFKCLHLSGPEGQPLVAPCTYPGCSDYALITPENAWRTGGRCDACFESALTGVPRKRVIDPSQPEPCLPGSPWG